MRISMPCVLAGVNRPQFARGSSALKESRRKTLVFIMAGAGNWDTGNRQLEEEWEQEFLFPNRPSMLPDVQEQFSGSRPIIDIKSLNGKRWQHIADSQCRAMRLYGNSRGFGSGLKSFQKRVGFRLQIALCLKPNGYDGRAAQHTRPSPHASPATPRCSHARWRGGRAPSERVDLQLQCCKASQGANQTPSLGIDG